ncbi:hypothetical protein [Pseudomonas sp. 11/12A]|uniref:hypothetical protein n=1 Tax=Pseudomonas sp. 11/12A TaxID=1506582 RepID=UPI000645CA28|nr:hypothetical protein [Pseudomonas sp. 11/12A]
MNNSRQVTPENKESFLQEFLNNIAWPAMAGNVAWSFFSVAIDPGCEGNTFPRLATLLALAFYLSAEWYRTKKGGATSLGLCFDLFLVICIVWFAIAIQANKGAPGFALVLILTAVGIGHLCSVWPPIGEGKGNIEFGRVNILIAVVLSIALQVSSSWQSWIIFFAMSTVLVAWWILRHGKTK